MKSELLSVCICIFLLRHDAISVNFTNPISQPVGVPFYYYYTPDYSRRNGESALSSTYMDPSKSSQGPGFTSFAPTDHFQGTNSPRPADGDNVIDTGTAFRYSVHPTAAASFNTHSYHPPAYGGYPQQHGGGWRPDGGFFSALEKILDDFNLDKLVFTPMANALGFEGVKGSLGMVKLAVFVALIIIPVTALILVPVTALVVILVLALPVPIWRGFKIFEPVKRGVEHSSVAETVTTRVLEADDCLERLTCKLGKLSKKLSKDSWMSKAMDSMFSNGGKTAFEKRVTRGFQNGKQKSDCDRFNCNPVGLVKKLF